MPRTRTGAVSQRGNTFGTSGEQAEGSRVLGQWDGPGQEQSPWWENSWVRCRVPVLTSGVVSSLPIQEPDRLRHWLTVLAQQKARTLGTEGT